MMSELCNIFITGLGNLNLYTLDYVKIESIIDTFGLCGVSVLALFLFRRGD